MKYLLVALMFFSVSTSAELLTVPVTGRSERLVYPTAAVNRFAGRDYAAILTRERLAHRLDTDRALVRRVRTVFQRLLAQALPLEPSAGRWPWQVHVVDGDGVQADSMAGGRLLIGAAFIRRYRLDDAQLAMVLGHEIGHALARHVAEDLSAVQGKFPRVRLTVAEAADNLGENLGVYIDLLPMMRRQEVEADKIAVYLAMRAGYSMDDGMGFFRKMARASASAEGGGGGVLDTHPAPAARLIEAAAFAELLAGTREAAAGSPDIVKVAYTHP